MQLERAVIGIKTLGPGNRLCIWVNGCHRRCKGCVSEGLQAPCPENEVDIEEYFKDYYLEIVDGVTISGGEPFDQASELKVLVKYFKDKGIDDILVYTGFEIEELRAKKDKDVDYILENIGVLIDGPYIEEQNTGKGNLKGSDNQRIIFINQDLKPAYDKYYRDERQMQEQVLGNILLSAGIPTEEYIKKFTKNQ